jgi:hypothetical protein
VRRRRRATIEQSSRSSDRSAAVPAARAGRVIRGFSAFNACFFALCTVDVRDRRRRAIERGPVRIARGRRTPLATDES